MTLTWNEIHADTFNLYNKIVTSFAPDIILGISTGGLVPSTILSKLFKCKLIVHGIHSYTGTRKGIQHVHQDGVKLCNAHDNRNILVVDDLCDTGDTLKSVKDDLNTGNNIKFGVLYTKPHSIFTPDFYTRQYSNNNWLTFPWEA